MRTFLARLTAAGILIATTLGVLLTGQASAAEPGKLDPVLTFMRQQVGKPYVWAANGPDAWDCSSLVQAAYRTINVTIPRITTQQVKAGQQIDRKDLQPGDLLFTVGPPPQPGHVGMYVGGDEVIEAKGKNYGVVVTPLAKWTNILNIVRPDTGTTTINDLITQAAAKEGLPRELLYAQINQESGFNPKAQSIINGKPGAMGIAQFMPGTWAGEGVDGDGDGDKDVWDPADAIPAMAKHMAALIRANDGDVGRALAGYNAGQGSVEKYNGIPPYPETQNYVRSIEAASGVSGRIELHPYVPPQPPLPQRVAHEAVRQVTDAVTLPPVPSDPVEVAHDLAVGILAVLLLLLALRRIAPQLRSAVRRAAVSPQRPARGVTASYAARAVAAAAARRSIRHANAVRRVRRRTDYRPTRLRSSTTVRPDRTARRPASSWAAAFTAPQRRRMPDGWTAPQRRTRRTAPSPTARASHGRTAPHRNRTALRWPLRWLRWPHRTATAAPTATAPHAPQPDHRNTATPHRTAEAPHRSTTAPQTTTATAPQNRTATAPTAAPQPGGGERPTATVPPQRTPATAPQEGTPMIRKRRAPIDMRPLVHLEAPEYARAQHLPQAIGDTPMDRGKVVVALALYLDELVTELAGAMEDTSRELGRRAFDPSVAGEMQQAAMKVGEGADHLRQLAWNLIDKHPDLFNLRVSTDDAPIYAAV